MTLPIHRFLPLLLVLATFAADPALRIEGVAGRDGVAKPAVLLSLADLQAMPRIQFQAKTQDGKSHVFEGVAVAELLKRAGLPQGEEVRGGVLSRYILVTAHDGYRVLFSLPELDPAFSDGRALLADRMDGQPLPLRDGPLRLVVPNDKRPTRWVRMVERIETASTPEPVR
jgi:DMSO/TMAO reductase YedYZ molybdopterin-dependent catalytic subunit